MQAAVDFNSYIDSHNNFVIKEYSLVLLDQNGLEILKKFGIAKPDILDKTKIDLKTRRSYQKYYQTHGITWRTGTESQKYIKSTLGNFLHKCYAIFVANHKKKQIFEQYLEDYFMRTQLTSKLSIVPLNNLGFKRELKNTRYCRKHQGRSKICAKDGVSQMVKFVMDNKLYDTNRLLRVHLIIDFNVYENNFEGVKELSLMHLDHSCSETDSKTMVIKPPKSSKPPKNYKEFYDKYGIEWKQGNIQSEILRFHLDEMLDRALFIFVKDHFHRKILFQVNSNCFDKIICLDDLGYDAPDELRGDPCNYHDNPQSNYCAERNVQLMNDWLRQYFEIPSLKVNRAGNSLNRAKNIPADPPAASFETIKYFLEESDDGQLDLDDLVYELGIDDSDAPIMKHALDSTVIEATGVLKDNNSGPIDIDLELSFDDHDVASLDPGSLYNNAVDNLEDYDFDLDLSSDLFRGADVQVNVYQENDRNERELIKTRTFSDPSSPESDVRKIKKFIDDWINNEILVDTYFVNSPSEASVELDFDDVDLE